MNCLLTSTSNPDFTSSPCNAIENNILLKLNSVLLNLQLEIIGSIITFKNNLMFKLSKLPTNPLFQSKPIEQE